MAPVARSVKASGAVVDRHQRRKQVESVLGALTSRPAEPIRLIRRPARRRTPPPEGRLGVDEDDGRRLRETLVALGPVFAGFGRYLATRVDLLPRRTRTELDAIPDAADPMPRAAAAAVINAQLGAPPERLFFEFHDVPIESGLWTERHIAWLSPGVPVTVTLVRHDALAQIEADVPLLALVREGLAAPGLTERALAAAIDDYALTLRRRLDQKTLAAAFTSLANDARHGGGFDAPVCYRDYCASGILTTERVDGEPLDLRSDREARDAIANRLATAWFRQAFSGGLVPYDFTLGDVLLVGDRLVLVGGAFEPHAAAERPRFAAYIGAVASDDPDAAAAWILDGASPSTREEVRLRRLLRQAVPFREGEWSGDERLAEHVLVQWRVASEVGWEVMPHHQHLYRGLYAVAHLTERLAPEVDTLALALDDERLRIGLAQVGNLVNPDNLETTLERAIQELVALPRRIDDVLTRAAEGRLRAKLQVPESDDTEHARNRTVLLVTTLVAFAALATVLRHLQPAMGSGLERVGALLLLVLGGWLLIAAARL